MAGIGLSLAIALVAPDAHAEGDGSPRHAGVAIDFWYAQWRYGYSPYNIAGLGFPSRGDESRFAVFRSVSAFLSSTGVSETDVITVGANWVHRENRGVFKSAVGNDFGRVGREFVDAFESYSANLAVRLGPQAYVFSSVTRANLEGRLPEAASRDFGLDLPYGVLRGGDERVWKSRYVRAEIGVAGPFNGFLLLGWSVAGAEKATSSSGNVAYGPTVNGPAVIFLAPLGCLVGPLIVKDFETSTKSFSGSCSLVYESFDAPYMRPGSVLQRRSLSLSTVGRINDPDSFARRDQGFSGYLIAGAQGGYAHLSRTVGTSADAPVAASTGAYAWGLQLEAGPWISIGSTLVVKAYGRARLTTFGSGFSQNEFSLMSDAFYGAGLSLSGAI